MYTRVGIAVEKIFWCCNKSVCHLIPISHGPNYCVHICELNPRSTLVRSIGSKMCSRVIAMWNMHLLMYAYGLHALVGFVVHCILHICSCVTWQWFAGKLSLVELLPTQLRLRNMNTSNTWIGRLTSRSVTLPGTRQGLRKTMRSS